MSIIQPFYKFLHIEESHNLVMGTARGPGLGAGFGLVLLDNVAIGIPIGLVLGLVIGIARQKGKGLVIYFLLKSATCQRSQFEFFYKKPSNRMAFCISTPVNLRLRKILYSAGSRLFVIDS